MVMTVFLYNGDYEEQEYYQKVQTTKRHIFKCNT